MWRRLALLTIAATLAACSSSPSKRCQDVCQREAYCTEELRDPNLKIDADECTSVCTALERDNEGKKIVDQHIECAKAASDCRSLLACE